MPPTHYFYPTLYPIIKIVYCQSLGWSVHVLSVLEVECSCTVSPRCGVFMCCQSLRWSVHVLSVLMVECSCTVSP